MGPIEREVHNFIREVIEDSRGKTANELVIELGKMVYGAGR